MYWSNWLIIALTLLLLEGLHPGAFFFLSFAFGSLCMMPLAWWGFSLELQLGAMLTISFGALIVLKYWTEKARFATSQVRHIQTNVDALIGQKILINKPLLTDHLTTVNLAGDLWCCKNTGNNLQAGDIAVVIKIEGNKLFIHKI